jgi:dolichyl-diphosphooligosaccharide--protein glycosyltransferase
MVAKTQEPFFQGSTGKNTRGVLRIVILCLIAAAAISSRLFSVIRTYFKPEQF